MARRENPAVQALRSQGETPHAFGGHRCEAYDCPLVGTWSSNTREGGPWWCFVHASADGMDLAAVTANIRDRDWLVALLSWVNGMDQVRYSGRVWREKAKVRLEQIGRPDMLPENLSKGAYIAKLRRQLILECTDGVRQMAKVEDDSNDDGWRTFVDSLPASVHA